MKAITITILFACLLSCCSKKNQPITEDATASGVTKGFYMEPKFVGTQSFSIPIDTLPSGFNTTIGTGIGTSFLIELDSNSRHTGLFSTSLRLSSPFRPTIVKEGDFYSVDVEITDINNQPQYGKNTMIQLSPTFKDSAHAEEFATAVELALTGFFAEINHSLYRQPTKNQLQYD
jgi:hypothetical protein